MDKIKKKMDKFQNLYEISTKLLLGVFLVLLPMNGRHRLQDPPLLNPNSVVDSSF